MARELVDSLHRELEAKGLSIDNVLVLTGNARTPLAHETYFRGSRSVTVLYHNVYFTKCVRLFATQFGPEFTSLEADFEHSRAVAWRKKDYISLNLTPRLHRVMLVASLLRDGLLAKGYVSFPDLNGLPIKNMSVDQHVDHDLVHPLRCRPRPPDRGGSTQSGGAACARRHPLIMKSRIQSSSCHREARMVFNCQRNR